jgi:hypothetical protein
MRGSQLEAQHFFLGTILVVNQFPSEKPGFRAVIFQGLRPLASVHAGRGLNMRISMPEM